MTPEAALASVWTALIPSLGSEALTVGVGIDLVDLAAFSKLRDSGGDAFLQSAWTASERLFTKESSERLAARWAAKEAIMKALGCGLGDLDPLDIEIVNEPSGAPAVVLHRNAQAAAEVLGVATWQVSLCHEDGWAVALAVAQRSTAATGSSEPNEGTHDV